MNDHRSRRGGLFGHERERLKQQRKTPMAFGVLIIALVAIIFIMLVLMDAL